METCGNRESDFIAWRAAGTNHEARVTAAVLGDRARVFLQLWVGNVQPAIRRVELTMAAEPGRRHTVELVDAAFDAREQILRLANTEQVPRPGFGQVRPGPVDHCVHV